MPYDCEIRHVDPQCVAAIRTTVAAGGIGAAVGVILQDVATFLARSRSSTVGPPIARYFRFHPEDVDVEMGWPVAPGATESGSIRIVELPGGEVARTVHVGPYDRLREAWDFLAAWIAESGWEQAGAPWEVYVSYGETEIDLEHPRTDLFWPVRQPT